MTEEEFIGIAAEAICRENGNAEPSLEDLSISVGQASAALKAVGAWSLRVAAMRAEEQMRLLDMTYVFTDGDRQVNAYVGNRLLSAIFTAGAE